MRRRAQNGRFDAGSGARGPGWVRPMASAPEVSQDSAVWSRVSPPSSSSAWHFLGVGRPPTAPSGMRDVRFSYEHGTHVGVARRV